MRKLFKRALNKNNPVAVTFAIEGIDTRFP